MFDPENDADWDMADLEAQGNAIATMRKRDICPHTSTQHLVCTDGGKGCGKSWPTEQAWLEDYTEGLAEFT